MSASTDFPITLAFPPQGHFTQPHLALPCLKAWLQQEGFESVEQRDLSVEAFDHFLSRDYLAACCERVAARTQRWEEGGARPIPFAELADWRANVEARLAGPALCERIEDAKRVLRGAEFWNPERYIPAVRTIYHSLRLFSAAHSPTQLTPHNFTMGYSIDRSSEVLAALEDEEQNPFLAFYRERVLPDLVARGTRVLGLSVIYGSQLIPALTLGRLVKQALPGCHVTAGGGFLAYIGEKLMRAGAFHESLDSIIFHEGEAPLAALCQALRAGEALDEVGSLTWFRRDASGVRAVQNPPAHPIQLSEAPAPDFDGLPFELYFSPELVLPYDINRGCYFGECTFCTLPTVIGPGYRTRPAARIAQQVTELRDRHQTSHFTFVTDCMPPGMIRDLPEELIARRAGITWWSDARIEPKAYTPEGAQRLFESGCRKLLFGFETATPRLLKLMKKGQSLRSVSEVATNCSQAGISVTFYAMVGFPSETSEEARATLDFIRGHADIVREVSLQTFHIDEVAATYREPEAFGIEILDDEGADLQLYHDYESEVGMTQTEAAEMFEEMMAEFRRVLPIFSGDNIYYFMQKSHYFLHLSRGTSPDAFARRCLERTRERGERGAEPGLEPSAQLVSMPLSHSYKQAISKLAHPLARAARPDFLTGRFVADAQTVAEQQISDLPLAERVLLYEPDAAEFVELHPDGMQVLRALELSGGLAGLERSMRPADDQAAEELRALRAFCAKLHRLGVLRSGPLATRR